MADISKLLNATYWPSCADGSLILIPDSKHYVDYLQKSSN